VIAENIVDEATGEEIPEDEIEKPNNSGKDPLAVELGRLGGLKGGKDRWKGTTKRQRSEAARNAVLARWKKRKK